MKDITTLFSKVSMEEVRKNFQDNGTLTSQFIDVCGFFLCRQGWVKMKLDDKEYLLQENDVCLYIPSSLVELVASSKDLEGIIIRSSLEQILPYLDKTVNPTSLIALRESPCTTLNSDQAKRLELLGALIADRQEAYNALTEQSPKSSVLYQLVASLAEAYFHELLYDYFCNNRTTSQPKNRKNKMFQNFMLSLMHHYKREREVIFYAREQCLSPRYFSTVVKEVSGHTASEWIIQIVVSGISQALQRSEKSIKEIAMEYNFPSQSFFGKYFKQYTGMSPKEYRRSHS